MGIDVKIAYARKAGTSHLFQNLPCQDYVTGFASDETACIVLTDGAGSVAHSEQVAATVAEALRDEFVTNFDRWYAAEEDAFIGDFIELCTAAVTDMNEEMIPACTVLLHAASEDGRSITCHIGDGIIFGIDRECGASIISEPENGEEPNETFFVSGPCPQKHLRVTRAEDKLFTDVIMCSDGAAAPLWNKHTNTFASALTRLSCWMKEYPEENISQRLAKELDESFREHTQDDMSIAIIHFVP